MSSDEETAMGFFEQFFVWLNAQLAGYVGTNTARVAGAIEPAVVTLATMYVMAWGYFSLAGRIQEPIWEGVKRILVIAVILAVGVRLWLYNSLLVDTFMNAPSQLAAAVLGATSPVTIVDQIWIDGNRIAEALTAQGGLFGSEVSFYLAAGAVYLAVGFVAAYTAFLIALSMIAIAILLALGPLFIAMLFFSATKRFFEQWIGQLANYALITILVSLIAALLLGVVRSTTASAIASGSAVSIAEAVRVCVMCALIFLVIRQIPSIAAGLSGGIGLTTFNAVSSAMAWGFGTAKRTSYEGMRGVMDGLRGEAVSRWDSLRRGGGNLLGSGIRRLWSGARSSGQGGAVVPRERVMPPPNRR
jgi:type IV secretion system protein VirB6